MMGSGKIGECRNGEIHLDIEVKKTHEKETYFKNQHSNIPISWRDEAKK